METKRQANTKIVRTKVRPLKPKKPVVQTAIKPERRRLTCAAFPLWG